MIGIVERNRTRFRRPLQKSLMRRGIGPAQFILGVFVLVVGACGYMISTEEMERGILKGLNEKLSLEKASTLRAVSVRLVRDSAKALHGIVTFDHGEVARVTVMTDGRNYIWEVAAEELQAVVAQRLTRELLTSASQESSAVVGSAARPAGDETPTAVSDDFSDDVHSALLAEVEIGRQKRTMGDMLSLATAVEAYAVDHNAYPSGACPPDAFARVGPPLNSQSLRMLEPTYVRAVPLSDAWGHALRYQASPAGDSYCIVSFGRDGKPDAAGVRCGPTTNFNDDIVYSNGTFLQWPEGEQQ